MQFRTVPLISVVVDDVSVSPAEWVNDQICVITLKGRLVSEVRRARAQRGSNKPWMYKIFTKAVKVIEEEAYKHPLELRTIQ